MYTYDGHHCAQKGYFVPRLTYTCPSCVFFILVISRLSFRRGFDELINCLFYFVFKAMRYLSYALYPLLVAGAVYSLVYYPHKR